MVIVPAQVYVAGYYAASYKCAHCEAQTGESYIRQDKVPVPVVKKRMAAPSTVAYVIQEQFPCIAKRHTGGDRVWIFGAIPWPTG